MQNQNYRNFNDERTEEEIAVGVPVNLSAGQSASPYFQTQQQMHQVNQNMGAHQPYFQQQNNGMAGMGPRMPNYMMPNPQIAPPMPQAQYIFIYIA